MADVKHTPGPWEVGRHPAMSRGWIVRPVLFGPRVMVLPEWDGGHVVLKSEADAHLIAAAPDLLEALKAARKHIGACECSPTSGCVTAADRAVVNAAIAKAEGRA